MLLTFEIIHFECERNEPKACCEKFRFDFLPPPQACRIERFELSFCYHVSMVSSVFGCKRRMRKSIIAFGLSLSEVVGEEWGWKDEKM